MDDSYERRFFRLFSGRRVWAKKREKVDKTTKDRPLSALVSSTEYLTPRTRYSFDLRNSCFTDKRKDKRRFQPRSMSAKDFGMNGLFLLIPSTDSRMGKGGVGRKRGYGLLPKLIEGMLDPLISRPRLCRSNRHLFKGAILTIACAERGKAYFISMTQTRKKAVCDECS